MKTDISNKQYIRAVLQIGIPILCIIVLFVYLIFDILFPKYEESVMNQKKLVVKELTETGWSIINEKYEQYKKGLITEQEAKVRAVELLRNLRFGPEMKDYFWINDMRPYMVMHPYRTDLENKDVTEFRDPAGKQMVVEIVNLVRAHGKGYVNYSWQWKDNPNLIVPKISYVKGFSPWGWAIGTGIYIEDAKAEIAAIQKQIEISVIVIVLLIIALLAYTLYIGIKKENKRMQGENQLRTASEKLNSFFVTLKNAIDKRDYSLRVNPENENDELAISLNKVISSLDASEKDSADRDWVKTGQTELNQYLSGEQKLEELCRKAITYISKYTGAMFGTFYIKDSELNSLNLIASYAFKHRKGLTNRFDIGEGLIGQAALEKESILFTEVPEDYFRVESSLGNMVPKCIFVIPLVYEDDVKGVIELATVKEFSGLHFAFLEQISGLIAVAINTVIFNEKLKILFDQTKQQAVELEKQQAELKATNEELEEQTQILKESEAKLQTQQEELQAANEEMEEKNEILEKQKREIEGKNLVLRNKQAELEENTHQLELATRYKSEFLANMSHELRTPLNSMLLLSKLLVDNEDNNLNEDQLESLNSIHRSGENLLHLINDILDLSKIEAKKIELNITPVKLESIIRNFEAEFKHTCKEKGLEFNTSIQEGLTESISTDSYRLEQIIRNLLGNAVKFTEKGSVSLNIKKPDPSAKLFGREVAADTCISISVEDTGVGIPEEKQHLIFEAFKQVDGSIIRKYGGTGLGLSISRELAFLLGGEIQLQSKAGEGSVFSILVPLNFKAPEPGAQIIRAGIMSEKVQENKLAENSSGKKVESGNIPHAPQNEIQDFPKRKLMLIIEDDSTFAGVLADYFQKQGYESIIASDGESGIKYVSEHKPTAIILDIGLPGIDGWAVLNELKNNPDTRHIPVHIMSGNDYSQKGLQNGAVGFLTKPVTVDDLKNALSKIEGVISNEVKELLVVEDDIELRNTILKLMSTNDIHAIAASSGAETLRILDEKHIDCIILDLGLPDISGFELLDKINNNTAIPRIPIIIYTGRDLTKEEAEKLENYSASIVLKSVASLERLLDETALFMHVVESDLPENQQKIIRQIREKESVLANKKVIVVDDDMRNAFALNKYLKSKGMQVEIANSGLRALEMLEAGSKPDIILMDIMMPEMDGYETIRRIRKSEKFKSIPVLALTAKAMESDREECLKSGANDYISKPIDVQKLLSLLRVWLY